MKVKQIPVRRVVTYAFVLLLLVIVVLSVLFPAKEYLPVVQWGKALESSGVSGMGLFVLAGIFSTSVGLPRQLVAFVGGLAYGVLTALPLSLLAALLGCFLTATVSRRFFHATVNRKFPKPVAALDKLIRDDLFLKVLVLRLQPLGTNLLTNICIGFTSASMTRFLAASAIGYVPQMLVFSLLGSGVRVGSQTQFALSAVLLVISIVLGLVLYRRHTRGVSD